MTEHKEQLRLERRRRLAKALKANLARRKAQRRQQRTSHDPGERLVEREASQEGCPDGAVVLGTDDKDGCKR